MAELLECETEFPPQETRDDGHIHEQVSVTSPMGQVEVDKGMVTMLQRIWQHGIHTHLSCENDDGLVWICLSIIDFIRFHEMTSTSDDLAYFVSHCRIDIKSFSEAHYEDLSGINVGPVMLVNIRFPLPFKILFEDLLLRIIARPLRPPGGRKGAMAILDTDDKNRSRSPKDRSRRAR